MFAIKITFKCVKYNYIRISGGNNYDKHSNCAKLDNSDLILYSVFHKVSMTELECCSMFLLIIIHTI